MADISTEVAGIKLRNPTMLASGFLDETGGTLLRVFKAGAGAVVTKSIGPDPRSGNDNPTIVELEEGMLNAMGLPNPGAEAFGSAREEHPIACDRDRRRAAVRSVLQSGLRGVSCKRLMHLFSRRPHWPRDLGFRRSMPNRGIPRARSSSTSRPREGAAPPG